MAWELHEHTWRQELHSPPFRFKSTGFCFTCEKRQKDRKDWSWAHVKLPWFQHSADKYHAAHLVWLMCWQLPPLILVKPHFKRCNYQHYCAVRNKWRFKVTPLRRNDVVVSQQQIKGNITKTDHACQSVGVGSVLACCGTSLKQHI